MIKGRSRHLALSVLVVVAAASSFLNPISGANFTDDTENATSSWSAAADFDTSVGRWRFDEGSGTTALDSSGAGHDGTISGATYVAGVNSTALDFTGGTGEVLIADHSSLDRGTGDLAIEAWFRLPSAPVNGISQPLVSKLDFQDDPAIDGYELAIYGDSGVGRLFFKLWDDAPSSQATGVYQAYDGTNNWSDNQWHHVVGQVNGSSVELWVDGVQVANTIHAAGNTDAANPLRLGADQYGANSFEGSLDEVALYDHGLSGAEIAAASTAYSP